MPIPSNIDNCYAAIIVKHLQHKDSFILTSQEEVLVKQFIKDWTKERFLETDTVDNNETQVALKVSAIMMKNKGSSAVEQLDLNQKKMYASFISKWAEYAETENVELNDIKFSNKDQELINKMSILAIDLSRDNFVNETQKKLLKEFTDRWAPKKIVPIKKQVIQVIELCQDNTKCVYWDCNADHDNERTKCECSNAYCEKWHKKQSLCRLKMECTIACGMEHRLRDCIVPK